MKGKLWMVLVLSIVFGLLMAACSSAPAATPTPKPTAPTVVPKPNVYTVGSINILTGDAAIWGVPAKEGEEVAVAEINAAGGINGVPLKVVYEDDRMNVADALTAYRKLVTVDKVPVIMAPTASNVVLSLCPEGQKDHIVLVGPFSTSPKLRDCGEYFFSLIVTDEAAGREWFELYERRGMKQVAVMFSNNDYGIGVKDEFLKRMTAGGYSANILRIQPYEVGATDFRTDLMKVSEAKPPTIFISGQPKEIALILRQARESGIDAQWIGDSCFVAQQVLDVAGEAAEGALGLKPRLVADKYEVYAKAFKALHGKEATPWSEFGYDATMVVAKAIEIGGYTSEGIRGAIRAATENYVGPSGAKKLDEDRVASGGNEWMIVKGGKFVLYQP